ncbi:MAG: cyclic nucleotide-binding domain-containing protein, partial [Mycobacteriaceae bacterium]|nr:cyclic nucleotide-binding domain-containing protein [Mycobacteriaceae bacterium]
MTVAVELGALPVFAGIPTDELTPLAAELTPIRAPAGEVLMRQGEKALSFLIIASGEAEVRHTDTDGQVLVAFLSEGLIGEIALLRNAPRTATVVATDEVCGYLGYEPA